MPVDHKPKPAAQPLKKHYQAALEEAEKAALEAAQAAEGFDDEVAVLRVKLLTELQKGDEADFDRLMKAVRLIVQATSVRYRMSGEAEDKLAQSVAGVLNGLGASFLAADDAANAGDGR